MPPSKRLPRVKYLRPRSMNVVDEPATGSCLPILVNMLNCWASYAEGAPQCASHVVDLKACMGKAPLETNAKKQKSRPKREWDDFTRFLNRINPPPHD